MKTNVFTSVSRTILILSVCAISNDTIATGTASTSISALPSGLIFRIAVGDEINTSDLWSKYQPVTLSDHKTEFGAWKEYTVARKERLSFLAKGCKNADILAYNNNKKITLEEAFAMMGKSSDAVLTQKISLDELDKLMNEAEKKSAVNYHITIHSSNKKDVDLLMAFTSKYIKTRNEKGELVYEFGEFANEDDANAYLDLLRGIGIQSAYLITTQAVQ